MDWFEAFLAFALTMVVFATMVTAVMEIIHRLLNSREAGFATMVAQIFDQVLWPRLRDRLPGHNQDELRAAFVAAMTRNPVVAERPSADQGAGPIAKVSAAIANHAAPTTVAGMTVMEFMERFAGTEVGKSLAQELDAHVTVAINDLAQKYDRFCAGATASFHNKARAWSVVVSFVLAFVLNIDAIRVFDSFLREAPLRQTIIDQYDQIEQALHAAEASSKAALASPSGKDELKEVQASLAQIQAKDAKLIDAGLPIGFAVFPWCHQHEDAGKETDALAPAGKPPLTAHSSRFFDSRCQPSSSSSLAALGSWAGNFVGWVFSVAIAGFLIGLGAPFWFNVATGLSQSMKLLKAMGVGESVGDVDKADGRETAGPEAPVPPRTPVEAFKTAIDASAPASAPRVLLSSTGDIDRGE